MELLAHGRDADVFALDAERVLRRYRNHPVAETEARVMNHVRAAGFPAPLVHDVSGPDMVLQRLPGPTLSRLLLRGEATTAVLAGLHDRLHALPAPGWLPRHPDGGDRITHFDLHPDNVIVTDTGPVVIDWTNAAAGDPALDVADTVVVLRVATPEHLDPADLDPHRDILIDEFVSHVDVDPGPRLETAIGNRLADVNLRPAEAVLLRRWRRRLAADTA